MSRFIPIPFTQVRINDTFWNSKLRINREISIPYQWQQCQETGRLDAFKLDWTPDKGEAPHVFWDSDVAKWVEAASYSLATHPDPELARKLEELVRLIASAQQSDGYLNTHFTQVEREKRWKNLRDCHELYCAGHLIEAAVAHHEATGSQVLLDSACRYADYIASVFGRGEGQMRGYCGHPEIELALVKLFRATGEKRYLELSHYFVDERGREPLYFIEEARARHENIFTGNGPAYFQAHRPVAEQKEAVGHAVRALYLYCAAADLALETGDPAMIQASRDLWLNVTGRKMYLTGGVGSLRDGEKFGRDYELPNETAYCETCAAIANVFWNHRLLQIDGNAQYADVLERALYNGVLSGVSLDGTRFFYENPLESRGGHHRQPWFGCSCCPSNLSRLLASLGGYVYARSEEAIAVNLYLQSEMLRQEIHGKPVGLSVETQYPWDGRVKITAQVDAPTAFTLRLRIPGWCRQHELRMGGQRIDAPVKQGYAVIQRVWEPGDTVELNLAMPVEIMESNPAVLTNRGCLALQRGPLVYCVEDANHSASVLSLALSRDTRFAARWDADLLGGVIVVEGSAQTLCQRDFGNTLFAPAQPAERQEIPLRAIPYFAWDNQAPGAMSVWIPAALQP